MTTIDSLSKKVLDDVQPSHQAEAGSVVLTITIIATIIKILLVVYDCWKAVPASALAKVNSPGLVQRFYLRRVVRKVLTKEGLSSKVDETVDALLKLGKGITQKELGLAIIETQADKTVVGKAMEYEVL